MSKAIVIFGTTTGSTETAADAVTRSLTERGMDVTTKNVIDASVNEVKDYDLIVLGASTWGEGDIQDDFIAFYDEMDETFKGKSTAVFGCGDSDMFSHCFCEAVVKIEQKAKDNGAKIVGKGFKVDGDVNEAISDIEEWAQVLAV